MRNALGKFLFGRSRSDFVEVLNDPILGELILSPEAEWWQVTTRAGDREVTLRVGGDLVPDSEILARMQRLYLSLPELLVKSRDFLAQERLKAKHSCFADELEGLYVTGINSLWPRKSNQTEIEFSGGRSGRIWGCAYSNGQFSNLGFDD